MYIHVYTRMNLDDFTAVLLIVRGVSLGFKHCVRCTSGPLTQYLGVLSVIPQRGMLNFLVRNIWTNNNHILSEQFTLFLSQNYIFKKYFPCLLPLAAPLTCGVPLEL